MTIVDVACWRDRALIGADSLMARHGCALLRAGKARLVDGPEVQELQRTVQRADGAQA
jgi:hypothetical protein